MPENSKSSEDPARWQENAEALQVASDNPITRRDSLLRLDLIRRVSETQRHKLFVRAVPPDEWLIDLSEAGVIRTRGSAETNCTANAATGESVCVFQHSREPKIDCRQPWCPFAATMRMRLITRLRAVYALERRRLRGL